MFIDPLWFLLSFGIGMLIVYFTTPDPEYVIRYPTPENAGKIIYKDTNNVCYKYRAESISCPTDRSNVKDMPIAK